MKPTSRKLWSRLDVGIILAILCLSALAPAAAGGCGEPARSTGSSTRRVVPYVVTALRSASIPAPTPDDVARCRGPACSDPNSSPLAAEPPTARDQGDGLPARGGAPGFPSASRSLHDVEGVSDSLPSPLGVFHPPRSNFSST